jgi:DNA primase
MDIKDIKQQLSIDQVIGHYGLKPDKNNRLLCPFHPDKTPSLQIYPVTNTYCCFSSNCNAGTGDQIQFIERKENCTKHEALQYMAGHKYVSSTQRYQVSNLDDLQNELKEHHPMK